MIKYSYGMKTDMQTIIKDLKSYYHKYRIKKNLLGLFFDNDDDLDQAQDYMEMNFCLDIQFEAETVNRNKYGVKMVIEW